MSDHDYFEEFMNSDTLSSHLKERRLKIVQIESLGDVEFGRFFLKDCRGIETKNMNGNEFMLYAEVLYAGRELGFFIFTQLQKTVFNDFVEGGILNLIDSLMLEVLVSQFPSKSNFLRGKVRTALLSERLQTSFQEVSTPTKTRVRL